MGSSCNGSTRMDPLSLCLCFCLFTLVSATAEGLPIFEHPIKSDGTLHLLVVGDWGRKGLYNQSQVAFQMGRIGDKLDIDFVISTGDNFYDDGLKGDDDPAFLDSFSNIYTANSLLHKPWFSVLGNHDYRGDVLAQLSPALTQIDKRWRCLRSFIVDADVAEFFFVDTTPFVTKYFKDPKEHTYDWRGVLPRNTYIAQLLKDVDSALRASRATWKIVVGHHPIRSVGEHGDTQELIDQLLPILQANNIDLYINGHDHCLEHIIDLYTNIQYLTSGGGSKAWRGGFNMNMPQVQFYYDGQGFMSMHITRSDAEMIFYDVFGSVVHKWVVSRQRYFINPILYADSL